MWDITENTYVIRDADNIKSDKKYDVASYLLGTNDLKVGKDGKREADHLLNTVEKTEIANKFIVELSPLNRKGKETKRRIFRCTLQQNSKSKSIKITQMTREIEESPIESALQDNLQINRNNVTQMAKRIWSGLHYCVIWTPFNSC